MVHSSFQPITRFLPLHSDTSPRSPDEANPFNPHIGQNPPLVATEPSTESEPSINPLFPLSLPCETYWTADEDNAPASLSFRNDSNLSSDALAPNPDPLDLPTSTSPGVTWGEGFTDNLDNDLYNDDWFSSKDKWDVTIKAFSPAPLEDVEPWYYGQDGQDPENLDVDDDTVCFSSGKHNNSLQLACPTNCTTSKYCDITTGRSSTVFSITMCRVGVDRQCSIKHNTNDDAK
ncbi:hypothetical protein BYT27DRAFT_7248273 [Phlegmacium glaucopus]|nr:hypothetical protein BYT27DRAFT_7248273 [Phlegmacium glaucopus]